MTGNPQQLYVAKAGKTATHLIDQAEQTGNRCVLCAEDMTDDKIAIAARYQRSCASLMSELKAGKQGMQFGFVVASELTGKYCFFSTLAGR